MPKDVQYGRTIRKSYARAEEIQDMPHLLEIQKNSYKWFLDEGLREVFKGVAAITDYSGNLELSFVDYSMNRAAQVFGGGVQGARRHIRRPAEGQRASAQP